MPRKGPAPRRVPMGNLGTRPAGCLLGLALLPWAGSIMAALGDAAHSVANFHLLFNLVVAACFMPVLRPYARLLQRLLPPRAYPHDPARPQYLDESAREVPAVALGQAAREALRLTDLLRESLRLTGQALLREDPRSAGQARYLNGAISQLDRAVTTYLATQDEEGLSADDAQYLKAILTFSMNIAHAAEIGGKAPGSFPAGATDIYQ